MITPNPKAHLSPKDRIRQLALEAQTIPGFDLNDRAFHASIPANLDTFILMARIHQSIKIFYLNQGHTLEQLQSVMSNPQQFNRVWRQSLDLMPDDSPPPLAFRRVLPLQSSI